MANNMYHNGNTSGANLETAQQEWGALYEQLLTSGFDSAAIEYINSGVPDAGPQLNPLYNTLVSSGLQQGWGYFYNNLNGKLNPLFNTNVISAFNTWGMPQSNYGHQCAVAHWGSGASVAKPAQLPPVGKGKLRPQGKLTPGCIIEPEGSLSPACEGGDPGGGDPGGNEDFCWWMDGFLAYIGIMAIPLSLEGAAFPPLGLGLGIAAAFAAAFAWAFCG